MRRNGTHINNKIIGASAAGKHGRMVKRKQGKH